MEIILYDKNGAPLDKQHDLQDKLHWCKEGEEKEQAFIRLFGSSIGYLLNPQKIYNSFAPDLISDLNILADLKSQHTPFFKAQELYKMDPTHTVVFNLKDQERYRSEYPSIDIIFHVDWIAVKALMGGKAYEVSEHKGIYKIPFQALDKILENAPVHYYKQRTNDTKGNALASYLIDIRNSAFEKLY